MNNTALRAEEYGKNKRSHWGIENSLHWVLDMDFNQKVIIPVYDVF